MGEYIRMKQIKQQSSCLIEPKVEFIVPEAKSLIKPFTEVFGNLLYHSVIHGKAIKAELSEF